MHTTENTVDDGWHDLVGNLGVAIVLSTYFLLQAGRMRADSLLFTGLNALAAVCIAVSLSVNFNLSSFIIEVCWFCISVYGMARILMTRRRPEATDAEQAR